MVQILITALLHHQILPATYLAMDTATAMAALPHFLFGWGTILIIRFLAKFKNGSGRARRYCERGWTATDRRESRGGPGEGFHERKNLLCRSVRCASEFFYTNRESITDYSTQVFTHWIRNMRKTKKLCKDAAHNGKNHENKIFMGPLKVWGAWGSIPCSSHPLSGPAHWLTECIW